MHIHEARTSLYTINGAGKMWHWDGTMDVYA